MAPSGEEKETLAEYVWRQCQTRKPHRASTAPLQPALLYHHLLVDDRHKVLYCYIPKVACSNWRRLLLVLTGQVPSRQMMNVRPHRPPYTRWLRSLRQFNQSGIHHRLQHYFKFMFVRRPLERLLSAWRNKFQSSQTKAINFRRKYLHEILQRYPHIGKTVDGGKLSVDKVIVPFEEFLRYIVDISAANRQLNEHWDYYHRMCQPCFVHYDFVGMFDTMEEDGAHLLELLNASREVRFPARSLLYDYKPTSVFMKKYQNVSASLLKQVVELYETDFALFNFSSEI
ncbi:hypothetical protein ACOMHN_017814 [Nucella lapillus]